MIFETTPRATVWGGYFIDNPLRRIVAKGPSQNVVATVEPAAEHRQDLKA